MQSQMLQSALVLFERAKFIIIILENVAAASLYQYPPALLHSRDPKEKQEMKLTWSCQLRYDKHIQIVRYFW